MAFPFCVFPLLRKADALTPRPLLGNARTRSCVVVVVAAAGELSFRLSVLYL